MESANKMIIAVSRYVTFILPFLFFFLVCVASGSEKNSYLNDLNSLDVEVRIKAAKSLAEEHDIDGVRAALKDPDAKVRKAAIYNLSISPVKGHGRRDSEAVNIFIESLNDEDAGVRYYALFKFRDYEIESFFAHHDIDPEICSKIAPLLSDNDDRIRYQAVMTVANCRIKSIEEGLLRLADDKDEGINIREAAVLHLSKSSTEGIDSRIIKFLDAGEDRQVTRSAILTLGALKSRKSVEKIIPYLYDKDQQMRYAAAIALGNIGDPKASEHLADVLVDGKGGIDSYVLESIGKVGTPGVLPKLMKIKPLLSSPNLKMKFAQALGATGSDDAVVPLIELLRDDNVAVQSWAAKGLEKFDSPGALRTIIEAAKEEPGNHYLASLAKKAQRAIDFPEEVRRERQRQQEQALVLKREQEINRIYGTGFRLFRDKQYERALPYFYEALEQFEALYASYPKEFSGSTNKIAPIHRTLAGYYRWKAKDIDKAIAEYEKLIATLEKYEPDKRSSVPYWSILGEMYETEVKDYRKAAACYRKRLGLLRAEEEADTEFAFITDWSVKYTNFLIERIEVLKLKERESFSRMTLKYPNVGYGFLMSFGFPVSAGGFFDEDLADYGGEFNSSEVFDKLYAKYPESYNMLFLGITVFHQFLKDGAVNDAELLFERLKKSYPHEIHVVMLQLDLAYHYKEKNNARQYEEALDEGLKMAKALNIELVLGPDSKYSSPEKTWNIFLESLEAGDIEAAVECFAPTSQTKYKEIFTVMKDHLNEMATDMGKISRVEEYEGRAEYEIIRTEHGQAYSYPLYFVDMLGEWKIDQF